MNNNNYASGAEFYIFLQQDCDRDRSIEKRGYRIPNRNRTLNGISVNGKRAVEARSRRKIGPVESTEKARDSRDTPRIHAFPPNRALNRGILARSRSRERRGRGEALVVTLERTHTCVDVHAILLSLARARESALQRRRKRERSETGRKENISEFAY